jgi:hypothetical protein
VEILPRGPRNPAMARWIEFMRRQGGGRVSIPYNDDFFFWWWWKVIALDDYPYAGINFIGDPDMPFPPGAAYGDIGKMFFKYFIFFCIFVLRNKKKIWMVLTYQLDICVIADVGPRRPEGFLQHR